VSSDHGDVFAVRLRPGSYDPSKIRTEGQSLYDEAMLRSGLRPCLLDAALVLVLAALSVPGLSGDRYGDMPSEKLVVIFGGAEGLRTAMTVWWLLAALLVVGLMIRRRQPLLALILAAIGAAGHQLDPRFALEPLDFAVPIVLYTVASRARTRWVAATAASATLVGTYLVTLAAITGVWTPVGKASATAADAALVSTLTTAARASTQALLVLVLAYAIGDGVRSRRAHLRAVEQRTAELQREQLQRESLAAAAERARLARELHDVVAHSVSVMVVQAQGAAAALHSRPGRADAAVQQVIGTGRAALAEMRRLLGAARDDPVEGPDLAPQPGVAAVPGLIDQIRASGIPVRLHIEGQTAPLPAAIDLSVYRIVQEALTNTVRHAGAGAQATVRLTFTGDHLEIEVTDDGIGAAAEPTGGYGLHGLAERMALLGGVLTVGPVDPRGFRVHARIPLTEGQP
jgi:signal transduction histidine kinase